MIVLELGDKFTMQLKGKPVTIEITKLDKNVTFMATGDNVIDPQKPRVLPTVTFAEWVEAAQ